MGNGGSQPKLTREQQDIKYLGDRYPFGDDELRRLYRSYVDIRQNEHRVSFLSDWAVHCTNLRPEEVDEDGTMLEIFREERRILMSKVEGAILPLGFGEHLEKVAFLRSQDIQPSIASDEEDDYLRLARLEKFFDGSANCGRRGGREALGTLFQCCVNNDETTSNGTANPNQMTADAMDVLDLAYRMSLASTFLNAGDNRIDYMPVSDSSHNEALLALSRSLLDYVKRKKMRQSPFGDSEPEDEIPSTLVQRMDFLEWAESTAPLLSSILPTFIHDIFFSDKPYPPSRTAFIFPKIPTESAFFQRAASPLLFSFASMSSSLGGTWHRLYTSISDGLSFNRLQNALLGYGGPTLLIVQATNGGIFGAFTASSWKESKDFYGNSDCFLYQLLPATAVYRPSGSDRNYMYCNSEARSRGYDGLAHGIGFGGTSDSPRFFISESFDGCIASSQDLTFESGPLLPRTREGGLQRKFEIDQLEVWGVGGADVVAEALGARNRQREITAANIQKARKVDKAAFLDDLRSGLIESKAFRHRDEMRGRADAEVDDKHSNAYVYEK